MQIQREGTLFERLTFDDLTTTGNAYVNVPFHFPTQGSSTRTVWRTEKIISKIFYFKATTNDLNIKILASDDEGDTFPIIAHAETLVAVGSPVRVVMGNYYGHLKIQVKPAVEGAHGTLSVEAYGFSNPNMTDVEISADTSGLATSAKQDTSEAVLDNIEDGIDEVKGLLGEVQASPTENTVLDRLKDLLTGISLAAGSEVIGSVDVDPRTTTTAALTVSASGDNTAIAAPGAGKHLAVYRLVMTVARGSEVDIILKSAATAKSGAMVADTYDLDFGDSPMICGTNEAFIVNLSAAVAVTGFVQYIEVAE